MFYKAVTAITSSKESRNFSTYFLSWNLQKEAPESSVWPPLIYTLIVVFSSLFVTHFASLKLAKHVVRMQKDIKRIIMISLKILSVLPSFVTAFVLSDTIYPSLTGMKGIFGNIGGSISIFFILILFFATALPIFFLNYINWFESPEMKQLNSNLISLAINTKKREKLYSKVSRRVIFLSWAITIVKGLGESVALKFVCSSSNFTRAFNSLKTFFSSNSHTISSMISSFYFDESGGEANRQAMFVYGIPLVIVAFLMNYFLIRKSVSTKYRRLWVTKYYSKITNNLKYQVEKRRFRKPLMYRCRYVAFWFHNEGWMKRDARKNKYRKFKESFISLCLLTLFLSVILVLIIRGLYFVGWNIARKELGSYSAEGLGVPLWNTLLLLFFSITWSLPICFFSALFLSAYMHKWKRLKYIFSSFLSGCGTVPPMLWAMFSIFLFIDQWKLSLGRVSIFAGALSLFILNLPFLFSRFFNLFENYLKKYTSTFLSLGLHPYNVMFLVIKDGFNRMKLNVSDSITRLNGESGLLFLTAGASKSKRMTFWGHGQTLTTKVFASTLKQDIVHAKSVIFETLLLLLLTSFLLFSIFTGMWQGIIHFSKKFFKKTYYKLYWRGSIQGIFSLSNLLVKVST